LGLRDVGDVKRTPCVFAERRNINNTGIAKRDGSQNKNEVTMFSGLLSYISCPFFPHIV
jgi:hypothetical protein